MGRYTRGQRTDSLQPGRSGRGDEADGLDRRPFRVMTGFLAVGAVASIVAIIATRRFLYADSSYFLLRMWEGGSFFIGNPSRWFGFAVAQWLPVTVMKLGWTDPGIVATLFGVNLWLNPVLAALLVWWASGRSREITLVVMLGLLFLFQSTYVVLDNESNVFFWLASIFFVLTLRRDYSYLSLALLVPIAFTHGVALLTCAAVLAVLLLARGHYVSYYGARRFWSLAFGLASVVALTALRSLVRDPGPNRRYFIEGALSLPGSPALMLTTVAFAALIALAFRPRARGLAAAFWVSTSLLLLLPFALPELLWPFYHYRARVLNAALALLVFGYLHGRVHWNVSPPTGLATRRVLWLATVVFLFQGKLTWEWARHSRMFLSELSGANGIVEFPTDGPFVAPRSRQFSWSWTSPTRSVVFGAMAHGEVRAIMLNADTTIWQPFDPRVPAELPDLSVVGVGYAPAVTER